MEGWALAPLSELRLQPEPAKIHGDAFNLVHREVQSLLQRRETPPCVSPALHHSKWDNGRESRAVIVANHRITVLKGTLDTMKP